MESDPDFLNEEEAARLWQRAAQLQAEAAQRAEKAENETAASDVAEGETADGAPPEGYALTHVRSAALDVGIANEFVDAALADMRAERALPEKKRRRLARWFLGKPPETHTVRRVIEATAQEVLSTIEAVFPVEPYRLTLTDRRGDPSGGGVLVFDVQGLNAVFPEGFAREARYGGIRQVFLSIQPIDGAKPSCEVTLRSPVAWSYTQDLVEGGILTGLAGAVGVGLGLAGGVALVLGPIGAVLVPAMMAAGGVGGASLGLMGYRAAYRYAIRRGVRALEGLLGAVASRAEEGWGITTLEDGKPPHGLPGAPDSSD
jgi:hypothetical protein